MLAAINTGIASTTSSITLGSTVLNIICAILYFRVAIFFDTYEWVYIVKPLVSTFLSSFTNSVILVAFIVKKEHFR